MFRTNEVGEFFGVDVGGTRRLEKQAWPGNKKEWNMLQVSDTASVELKKVLEKNADKGSLVIFFQGMG